MVANSDSSRHLSAVLWEAPIAVGILTIMQPSDRVSHSAIDHNQTVEPICTAIYLVEIIKMVFPKEINRPIAQYLCPFMSSPELNDVSSSKFMSPLRSEVSNSSP
jgi:hypothetical protein